MINPDQGCTPLHNKTTTIPLGVFSMVRPEFTSKALSPPLLCLLEGLHNLENSQPTSVTNTGERSTKRTDFTLIRPQPTLPNQQDVRNIENLSKVHDLYCYGRVIETKTDWYSLTYCKYFFLNPTRCRRRIKNYVQ